MFVQVDSNEEECRFSIECHNGVLDAANSSQHLREVDEVVKRLPRSVGKVHVMATGLTYLDSEGIKVFLKLHIKLKQLGMELYVDANRHVYRLLDLLGYTSALNAVCVPN